MHRPFTHSPFPTPHPRLLTPFPEPTPPLRLYHLAAMPAILRWLLRLGPTNPITVRLVQNASRRPRHFYIRAGYLAVLIVVLLWSLLINTSGDSLSYRQLAEAGAKSFTYIAYLQIILICILAPVFMAGAIAQESHPRTWEVLLTTPMNDTQIVLGNLLGRLFFILALLVCSLPLMALTQYFGGVPGAAIFKSYLIAAAAAVCVGSIAISLSVSRLAGKRAVFAFYVAVVSYLAITIAIDRYLVSINKVAPSGGITWMTAVNPFLALHSLLNPSSYGPSPAGTTSGLASWFLESPVSTFCAGTFGLSALLVGLSTFTVRAGGLQTLGTDGGIPWYRRLFGLGAAGAEHRPPRAVSHNPIAWREASARNATLGRSIARWSFVGTGLIFGLLLLFFFHTGSLAINEFQLALIATVWGEVAVITLVAINMAATAVSREREDGTLDLILTTPITPGAYLKGKLQGLIAYLLPMLAVPVGTLGLAGVYVLFGGLERAGGVMRDATVLTTKLSVPVVLPEAAILLPLVIVPFIAFCAMVGLQWSLKSKGTLGSVVSTVAVVGIASLVIGLCAFKAGESLPVVGPVLNAMSPATLAFSLVYPVEGLFDTVSDSGGSLSSGLTTARFSLAVGALIAGAVYVGIVYAIHMNMVRTFDFTVRKLAGTN